MAKTVVCDVCQSKVANPTPIPKEHKEVLKRLLGKDVEDLCGTHRYTAERAYNLYLELSGKKATNGDGTPVVKRHRGPNKPKDAANTGDAPQGGSSTTPAASTNTPAPVATTGHVKVDSQKNSDTKTSSGATATTTGSL